MDFCNFFIIIFSKELRNKNVLKFSPCHTTLWNLKWSLLRERPTFSTSVMVSVAVSKLGCTELFCATWSESEWRLLSWSTAEGEADAMHQGNSLSGDNSGDNFIFQQDSAPANRARDTIALYAERRQTSFLPTSGLQTAQIWIPWVIRSGL